jgi:hypothetical protein
MNQTISTVFQGLSLIVLSVIAWKLIAIVRQYAEFIQKDAAFLAECKGISMVPWEMAGNVVGLICETLPSGRQGVKPLDEIGVSVENYRRERKLTKKFLAIPFGLYRSWNGKTFYEGVSLFWP